MDTRYEAHSFADPLFYDSPVRWGAAEEFAASTEPVPTGWARGERGIWVMLHPVGVRVPEQGWKVHVSATLGNAEQVLATVRDYCLGERLPFKFLRGLAVVQMQNAKYAARAASGKFCTLYPVDDEQLARCLSELGTALDGEPGPYVLSDLRWRRGPLYLRYGAFTERWLRDADGVPQLAFTDPEGTLVPDVRAPVFEVPDWAPVPEVLREALAERKAARGGADKLPYQVERALHFSNAGGIYLAREPESGRQVVLKEGRPHAGLDQRGADAPTRLRHEAEMLRLLAGVAQVPELIGQFTAWEHEFLAQEYVEGETLNAWLAHHYPLIHPDPSESEVADYAADALALLDRIEAAVAALHRRGVVFGDLHPHNIMVRPDGEITFIDFELASPIGEFVPPALGAAGFAVPGLTGFEVDLRALAALRLWFFLPLQQLLALDPGKAGDLADAAAKRFALPAGFADRVRRELAPRSGARTTAAASEAERSRLAALLSAPAANWPALRDSLARGILAAATPEREDRLFPGDIAQFSVDALGLAYGAAGVLYALHATGAPVEPDHVRWLVEAERRRAPRPGLWTGSHGVAVVLALLGEQHTARQLIDQLTELPLEEQGEDLATGLAGTVLTLLHFSWDRPELLDVARRAGGLLAERQEKGEPSPTASIGLLRGGSGQALALLRLFERSGEEKLLDCAERALDRDLARCTTAPDGTLQVRDKSRLLPYLEKGGTGIGLALEEFLVHRPDSPLAASADPIRRSAEPEFVIQPNLFNGRAGLILYLAEQRRRHPELALDGLLERHRRALTLHLVPYRSELAFPGEQLLRLSTDLATGSAGVLLALGAALAGTDGLPLTGPPRAH
ncbi:class III lanthionine synthetase LanKC [Kitasatospora sp. RB6PN24]|uniref:class III lanthionine synthetase LanKC n=1 Tax=Kitasatospora humi TaxID=2893891 RepID=UPI001E49AF95|nr:class III lanthionine synthetase LanKC [Kitasatospora humi]MCC9309546.1 class III lanthionine synthetase LanKC [Kitasatospora humi]